jgi:peptidoglycan/xylan/chitin deacetylase (PgdA/CDA1 family)
VSGVSDKHRLGSSIRQALKPFAAALLTAYLRSTSLKAGAILVYHEVAERQGDPHSEIVPPVGRDVFARQIAHLRRRYRVVPAAEIVDAIRRRRRGQRFPVAITFDDDLPSHTSVAAPILRAAGVHATFFLTGASLERPYRFWWQRLQDASDRGLDIHELTGVSDRSLNLLGVAERVEQMRVHEVDAVAERLEQALGGDPLDAGIRADDIRDLARTGFDVGFHTRRHHLLPRLDETQLALAMSEGRAELATVADRLVDLIAYPHGKGDPRVARAAEVAGFHYGFVGSRRAVSPETDRFLLDRMGPSFRGLGAFAFDIARAIWLCRRR